MRIRVILVAVAAAIAIAACPVCAKKPPAVQFVNIAPLPGAGLALDENGRPDGQGAIQVNIPVAYTPGAGFVEISAYRGKYTRGYPENVNGSGVLGLGFGGWPRLYASAMAVSSELADDSKAVSAQLQVFKETANTPAVAVGAQDILDKEHKDFGAVANTGISYYAVATKRLKCGQRPVYATLGYGAARFLDRPFGGLSTPLNDRLSVSGEYDGFQLNGAVSWRPTGRYCPVTLLAGYNGQAGALFGIHITSRANTAAIAPVACLLLKR